MHTSMQVLHFSAPPSRMRACTHECACMYVPRRHSTIYIHTQTYTHIHVEQVIEGAPPHVPGQGAFGAAQRELIPANPNGTASVAQSPLVVRPVMAPRSLSLPGRGTPSSPVGATSVGGDAAWRRQEKKQLVALGRRLWQRTADVRDLCCLCMCVLYGVFVRARSVVCIRN